MGEIKTITFQFNISIITSFRRSPSPLTSTHQNIKKQYIYTNICQYASIITKINKTMYNKAWVK